MKIKSKIILVLVFTTFLINGCTKETVGPAGPAGTNGNANIISSNFSVSSWSWSSPYYYVDLPIPELTAANLNSAAVVAYFNAGGNNWVALPYTQYHSPYNYYMGFNTSTGNVEVTWVYDSSLSSGSDPNAFYSTNVKIKVVVIPPAIKKANPSINWNNYEEVKEKFDLK